MVADIRRWTAQHRTLALFLLFWLIFGATTNTRTQRNYNLQQMGVDAVGQHHTFTLGHNPHPLLRPAPGNDTFWYKDNILAAKQPGQFAIGAIPYLLIRALGVSYESDYDLAAALVTWLSAGLLSALALAMLERMLRAQWGFSARASLAAVLGVGLASHWFCYSGVAHHDVIAGSLLVLGLCAIEENRYRYEGRSGRVALGAGALLGLVVFTSMLPALIVVVVGVYALTTLPLRTGLWHGAGFAVGLAPLLTYNAWYFGNPLVQGNIAGNFNDTFFRLGANFWAAHLNAYLGLGGISLWKFAPALALGIAGLFLLPRRLRFLLCTAVAAHLIYLTHIETMGGCQYGPRYLLPLLPLLAPGVAAMLDLVGAWTMTWIAGTALVLYGFTVNLVGAMQGAMYCGNLAEFAFAKQVGKMGEPNGRPLTGLVIAVGVSAVMWAWWQSRETRAVAGSRAETRRKKKTLR